MIEHVAGRDAEVVRVRRRQGLEVTANLVDEVKAELCARVVCGVGVKKGEERSAEKLAVVSCE